MKCPKCGSNNIKVVYECSGWNEKGLGKFEQCRDCHTAINEYQARLDKVLSKFEKNRNPKSNEYYYHWTNGLLMAIDIDRTRKFSLYNNEFPIYISLETVESLLKDLEELE